MNNELDNVNNEVNAQLNNDWISLKTIRGRSSKPNIGLTFQIKAHPDLEAYMANLSGGRKVLVDAIGEMWQSMSNKSLEVYDVGRNFPSRAYTLEAVGLAPLPQYVENLARQLKQEDDVPNLSFLKLVGISEPNGVTVGIAGPYSLGYLNKFKQAWQTAAVQFLRDYIVPVTFNLSIVSKQ